MDIFKPENTVKLPAVVFVTGGGFITAPRSRYLQQRARIAEAGYVVASIEYRVSDMVGTSNGVKEFDKGEYLEYSSEVKAAIDIYGLSDLTKIADDFPTEVQEIYEHSGSSPAVYVNGLSPFGKYVVDVVGHGYHYWNQPEIIEIIVNYPRL